MLFLVLIFSTFQILEFSDNKVYWCFPDKIFLGKLKKIFRRKNSAKKTEALQERDIYRM